MEAPDKIYLQENTTTDCYGELWPEWFEGTHHPERDICYLRKDALLEWAKEKKKQLFEQESANDEPSDVAAGINAGLDMVMEKLNSM